MIDQVGLSAVTDPDAQRRLLGYPRAAVRHHGELGERATARAAFPFLLDVDRDPPAVGRLEVADQAVGARAVVPDIELGHCRVPAHSPAIGIHAGGYRGSGPRRLDPVVPRGYHKTGGKTLDVPFEWAGESLVKVAQVK